MSESEVVRKEDIHLVLPEKKVGRKSKEQQEQYLAQRKQFADMMVKYGKLIGFKVSSRGWCYAMEGDLLITKSQFDIVQNLINECRKNGELPIDFVDPDSSRDFAFTEDLEKETKTPQQYLLGNLSYLNDQWEFKDDIAFWQTQEYYIQMMVEKRDVKTLFDPICQHYHIPLANAKGWSDISQRADLVARFKWAKDLGKKCVLLYFGDFDPAGIKIAQTMHKNIKDLELATQYDSSDMIVDHFGLSYEFIQENNLVWVENLETGSKLKNADGSAKTANEDVNYVKEYVEKYGRRKCEANAILKIRDKARQYCRDTIAKYIDKEAVAKWKEDLEKERLQVKELMEQFGIFDALTEWIPAIEEDEKLQSEESIENNSSQEVNSPDEAQSEEIEEGGTADLEPENSDQVPTDQPLDIVEKKYVMMYLTCPECYREGFFQVLSEDAPEISSELLQQSTEQFLEKWQNAEKDRRKYISLSFLSLKYKCLHCRIYAGELDKVLSKEDLIWVGIEEEFLNWCYVFIPPSGWERVVKVYLQWRKSIGRGLDDN